MSNIVAIVGRPNVGKSTLFNRMTETRKAIVDEMEGVTRDRHYGKCVWNGIDFSVIDTGGYIENSEDVFEKEISKQVLLAIEEADVIYFMVDVETGITELDDTVAALLRKIEKPVIVVVNKVDNNERRNEAYEFYSLGFDNIFFVSSMSGSGTGEILDRTVEVFNLKPEEEEIEDVPKFTIVGRPNVGKSSFLNALVGEERNIVTAVAGTTRDTINTRYKKFNKDFFLVDTAGLRKRSKQMENVEFYSVMRSIRAIESADVCFLIIDATLGIEGQDLNIFRLIQKNHKGLVILVNKWDLVEKDNHTLKEYEKAIHKKIEPFTDVPIMFISALTKQRIFQALEMGEAVYENRRRKIKTAELNTLMLEAIENTPPPSIKGKYIKIKYVTQLQTYYPAFVFFANLPQYIKEPYKRFLENQLRKNYNFNGVPIEIFIRKK
ncbi:MAG: ribosome biogenesis GTPase Der [Bacteroidales bacterium]|nr:ribosome biogenesis GTPase Der [Bacteroidales bacterium]